MLSLQVAMLSEIGGRKYNEDAGGHWRSEDGLYCVLADGAGGHGGGDVASRLAVTSLLTSFSITQSVSETQLTSLVRKVNQTVIDGRVPGTVQQDMHATIVCLVIDAVRGKAIWAHSGDSRLYWFRDNQVLERTRDHSFVQSLVDAGMIQESETRSHPKRSELYSALGKSADEFEVATSAPSRDLEPGDVFLLCSDGVWEYLTDEVLATSLTAAATPEAWVETIKNLIIEATNHSRNNDNYTALTVWVGPAA